MPITKKRSSSIALRNEVSALLDIRIDCIFITGTRRMELRIWTKDMSDQVVEHLMSKKVETKRVAAGFGCSRISLSKLHPRDAQKAEDNRRLSRGKARKARHREKGNK